MSERKISFRDAIAEVLEEEMNLDRNLVIIGEDIVASPDQRSIIEGFNEKFPNRIINHMPLVEDMLCGISLGMNLGGLKPVIQFNHLMFYTLAFSEIYKICTWRYRMAENEDRGIVIMTGLGGNPGFLPELEIPSIAPIFHIPNIWIAAPAFPYYAKGLFKTALRANRPVIFIMHRSYIDNEGFVPEEEYTVPFGTSVTRAGKDITIISWLDSTFDANGAANLLKNEKVDAGVISLQTLNPLDMKTILSEAKKTGRVVIVEKEMERGGIGAEISARITEAVPECRIARVAAKNIPLPGGIRNLEKFIFPSVEDIVAACRKLLHR